MNGARQDAARAPRLMDEEGMRKDAPIISCFHLAVRADGDRHRKLIDDVSLELPTGSWNEVIGEPGAGKSVLFAVLSLRLEPDDGKLLLGGRNLGRLSSRGVADLRRTMTSCGQWPLLLDDRTVLENLVLPFVVRGEPSRAASTCEALLEEVGLSKLRDIRVGRLGHEERLMVGALRALAPEPSLVLLDGVLEQLSEPRARQLVRLLQQRNLAGGTVVLFGREESSNARRGTVYRLHEGQIDSVAQPQMHERVPEATGRVA